jgi:hypothetical protein
MSAEALAKADVGEGGTDARKRVRDGVAEISNRKNLAKLKREIFKSAKVPAEGTAPTPAIDLSTEIKKVDDACFAYINTVHAEIGRLDGLINESGTHVGL